MVMNFIKLKDAIKQNPILAKMQVSKDQIDKLKESLEIYIKKGSEENRGDSEEYHKGLISDLLESVWYKSPDYSVSSKDYIDLAIFNGNSKKPKVIYNRDKISYKFS